MRVLTLLTVHIFLFFLHVIGAWVGTLTAFVRSLKTVKKVGYSVLCY